MTTLTITKAIVLSLTIGLAQAAAAEPFNDRGEDFLSQVPPGLQATATTVVVAPSSHFNDQSRGFPVVVESDPGGPQRLLAVTPSHFNDRSAIEGDLAPVSTEPAPLTAGAAPSRPAVRATVGGS